MNRIVSQIIDKSHNNMGKEYWGPLFWYLLHMITYKYPLNPDKNTIEFYNNYFNIVSDILPCSYCKSHFKDRITKKNLKYNLENRESIINWFKEQHNEINLINSQRVFQGFEVDNLYENTDFNHQKFKDLVLYLLNETKDSSRAEKKLFLTWLLLTIKILPSTDSKKLAYKFIENNDISKYDWNNYKLLYSWTNSLLENIKHI